MTALAGLTALELMATLRLEDGRPWGAAATDLQRADALAVLEPGDGPRRHWLGRAKGFSKTGDTAAMSLAVLLTQLRPGSEAYAAANDADQAGLLLRAIRGWVDRTPLLADEVVIESRRVLCPKRGTDLIVLPADSAGSHGLKPSWLVVDELGNWSEDERHRSFLESLLAGLPKTADSRCVVMSTAGAPGHFAERHFVNAGRDPAWRLSNVTGPSPWMGEADIAAARRTLMPSTFDRFFQNQWVGAEDRLANWDQLRRAATLDGPQPRVIGHRYFMGADLGLTHDRTAIAVVHSEPVGDDRYQRRRFVVDRIDVRAGTKAEPVNLDSVEQLIFALHAHYDRPRLRIDPWQGALMSQRLRMKGVAVEQRQYSAALFDEIATTLHGLLREGLVAIPKDQALLDELASVKVRETSPGRLRLDTATRQQHDDQAMAIGYAVTLAKSSVGTAARRLTPEEREEHRRWERRGGLGRPLTAGWREQVV